MFEIDFNKGGHAPTPNEVMKALIEISPCDRCVKIFHVWNCHIKCKRFEALRVIVWVSQRFTAQHEITEENEDKRQVFWEGDPRE